jgi:[ribosomal protein S5]-alanine N-acetyltransferase
MLPWLVFFEDESNHSRPRLAGQLTVSGIVGGSASWGQIGYWIDQRLAGHGIIPTAVALAVDYCFQVMSLHRIEIAIRPENTKSLRVVAKLGFRPEGLRPRYLHIDGDWRDHLVFALNAEEVPEGLLQRWENLRQR